MAIALVLSLFSAIAGSVYAVTVDGDMLFYKYAGAADGSPNWPIQAKKIGMGGISSRCLLETKKRPRPTFT